MRYRGAFPDFLYLLGLLEPEKLWEVDAIAGHYLMRQGMPEPDLDSKFMPDIARTTKKDSDGSFYISSVKVPLDIKFNDNVTGMMKITP